MKLEELIQQYKQHEVDFLIPNQDGDVPLYLDLYLFYETPEERWHKVQAMVYEYFNHYLKLYRAGKIASEELIRALHFPEVKQIALGHCKSGVDGKGTAGERAKLIKDSIFDDPKVQEIGMDAIATMSVEIDNVGPDMLSDTVANFAMPYLLEYTKEQVDNFGLNTAEFQIKRSLDPETFQWRPILKVRLPYFETTGEPRILIPKHLVRRLPAISTMGFYNNYLRHILRQEFEDQVQTLRTIGKRPRFSFKLVAEELKKKYGALTKATRAVAKERPELIGKYLRNPRIFESSAWKRRRKENIDWDGYITELKRISTGQENARRYAEYLRKIFTAIYGGHLFNGRLEEKSEGGIFSYDISFANSATTPFFKQISNQNIKAGVLLVEAKNYGLSDLTNKEFNQSRSYTIVDGRDLIFLVTRKDVDEEDLKRARQHFLRQRCIILPISDRDIINLIEARRADPENFDMCLVERLQKILSA